MDRVRCRTLFGKYVHLPREKLTLRAAVYGVILHEEKILLLSVRHTGRYCFPGGGVEVGEPLTVALRREIREEAGIEVDIGPQIHFQEDFFYYDPLDVAFHSFLFYFRCYPLTFDLLMPEQVDDDAAERPRWIEVNAINKREMQDQEQWLVDWLSEKQFEF